MKEKRTRLCQIFESILSLTQFLACPSLVLVCLSYTERRALLTKKTSYAVLLTIHQAYQNAFEREARSIISCTPFCESTLSSSVLAYSSRYCCLLYTERRTLLTKKLSGINYWFIVVDDELIYKQNFYDCFGILYGTF